MTESARNRRPRRQAVLVVRAEHRVDPLFVERALEFRVCLRIRRTKNLRTIQLLLGGLSTPSKPSQGADGTSVCANGRYSGPLTRFTCFGLNSARRDGRVWR